MINRRDFLKQSAQLAGGLSIARLAGTNVFASSKEPPFKISLAEWSLNKAIFGGKLEHLDFARTAKNDFGIKAVEYVNQFFMDKAQDEVFLKEMRERASGEGVESLLIMCDGEGYLGDPDEQARGKAVENHHKWVEAAVFLGCHSIRVNARSEGSYDEQMKLSANGLRRLTEFGDQHDINVIVENHGGLSSNGKWLTGVMEMVDHPRCGTLPDFGNFRIKDDEWYDRYEGVSELLPYAKAVSAKSNAFDENGNETSTDYFRMMKIVIDSGYHGYVGIEYEGKEMSEMEGIRATKRLLERVRDELEKTTE
ncbi:MAG: sugar phosphate isomerase/epimerase family protein [Candidatus Neomarinimicrobiota bacterium]